MSRVRFRLPTVLFVALLVVAVVGLAVSSSAADSRVNYRPAKNVILFVGDGMGPAARTAARLYKVGMWGKLAMEDMDIAGVTKTHSTETIAADSAATATSLATGVKTYDAGIGVDVNKNPVPSILDQAQASGRSVGLISTVQLAHATPAGFSAHIDSRNKYLEIALQQFEHNIDVMLAGGESHWLPKNTAGCYPADSQRTDGRNLVDEAVARGYTYVCNEQQFNAVDPAVTGKLLGLFGDLEMLRPYTPSLEALTEKAIAILSKNKHGFFLMVEGGQIDWAEHADDAANMLGDMVGFDDAVQVGKDFARDNPDTLIIVTGDHDTGGMAVERPQADPLDAARQGPFTTPDGMTFYVDWNSDYHTALDVITTAQGPFAFELTGYYENTHIYTVMAQALGVLRLRASGICPQVAGKIPPAVAEDATKNPQKYAGWGVAANPNLAAGPSNPYRTWLTLMRPDAAHSAANPAVWAAGCP